MISRDIEENIKRKPDGWWINIYESLQLNLETEIISRRIGVLRNEYFSFVIKINKR